MAELCPECGSQLPSGARFSTHCPACLMRLGLAGGAGAASVAERHRDPAPLAVGSSPQISSETQSLLRGRLQVGAAMILVGMLLFVVRDQFDTPGRVEPLRLLVIAFYGGAAALLRSARSLSLARLRLLEVAIVWVVATWFALDRYSLTLAAVDARDESATLWSIAFSVMVYFSFLTAYGFLTPNTWRRALCMTGLLAITPMVVPLVIGLRDADAGAFLVASQAGFRFSSMALMLAIGVMIATWGAHRIHTLRIEAFEARRLGQYRLVERIGSGGMGEVWRAEHRLLVRPAAIKVIRPEVLRSRDAATVQDFLRSFEREAQTTASLRSIHTVELFDFGVTADSALYYVMELLDGLNLEDMVRRHGPLPAARVVYLLEQVCDSLADAHDHGLVHRDVKPANLYVCRLGRRHDFVKVLDFGLVRSGDRRSFPAFVADRQAIVGTPSYIAPEMAAGDADVDGRADIYSCGCVAYWLLTGERAFDGQTAAEIIEKQRQATVVPPSERGGREIPSALERIVLQCLEKNPAARPQSAEQLAELLAATGLAGDWTQDGARAWWREHGGNGRLSAGES